MATLLDQPETSGRIDKSTQPLPSLSSRPISGERYWSRDFMAKEWDHIWTKAWLIGGLASQVAKPGDFFTYDIGRESILVTHGEDGQIRAFYNVCPHRGMRVCTAEAGNKPIHQCIYHGWAFKPDGDFIGAPVEREKMHGNDVDKRHWG